MIEQVRGCKEKKKNAKEERMKKMSPRIVIFFVRIRKMAERTGQTSIGHHTAFGGGGWHEEEAFTMEVTLIKKKETKGLRSPLLVI
jgi:hypothetical protein